MLTERLIYFVAPRFNAGKQHFLLIICSAFAAEVHFCFGISRKSMTCCTIYARAKHSQNNKDLRSLH
jgi:hypothetical protein